MTNNDLWCKECKSQHHPMDECYSQGRGKEQKIEQAIDNLNKRLLMDKIELEERIAILISEFGYECMNYGDIKSTEEYVRQIISLVRADERKAERERIREGVEKNIAIQSIFFDGEELINVDDIRKLLRPESDTEGK